MPHNRPPLQLPSSQPAPFARGIQGATQGFLLGLRIKRQREQDELDLDRNKLAQQKLDLNRQKFAQSRGQAFISAVESMIKLPSGTTKMMAPTVFQSFFDIKSEEGKRFMSGLVNPSPEDGETILRNLREALNFKGAGVLMATEEFKRDFFNNPIATFSKMQDAAKKAKDLDKAPKTKAVLDRQATQAAGKPRLKFATEKEIQDSGGNLTPPPTGLKLRIGKDGEIEIVTGGGDLTNVERGRLQESSREAIEMLTNLGSLRTKITDLIKSGNTALTIGPLGAFVGFLNKTVAGFIPGLFNRDRAAFENYTKTSREMALRTVGSDPRFSNVDRAFVSAIFPAEGPFESAENALSKIRIVQALFLRRLGSSLKAQGIETADVPTLSPGEVRNMVLQDFITEGEGAGTLELLFPTQFAE